MQIRSYNTLRTDLAQARSSAEIENRDHHLVVRTSDHPEYYWGNFIAFDAAPRRGDSGWWVELFRRCFKRQPGVTAAPQNYTATSALRTRNVRSHCARRMQRGSTLVIEHLDRSEVDRGHDEWPKLSEGQEVVFRAQYPTEGLEVSEIAERTAKGAPGQATSFALNMRPVGGRVVASEQSSGIARAQTRPDRQ
jgi:hypothetical protein